METFTLFSMLVQLSATQIPEFICTSLFAQPDPGIEFSPKLVGATFQNLGVHHQTMGAQSCLLDKNHNIKFIDFCKVLFTVSCLNMCSN